MRLVFWKAILCRQLQRSTELTPKADGQKKANESYGFSHKNMG
jgi:hypothetical protein